MTDIGQSWGFINETSVGHKLTTERVKWSVLLNIQRTLHKVHYIYISPTTHNIIIHIPCHSFHQYISHITPCTHDYIWSIINYSSYFNYRPITVMC